MPPEKTVYLASPLGFSPETRPYLERIKKRLRDLGCEVFDPWEQTQFSAAIAQAHTLDDYAERAAVFAAIAAGIGRVNEEGIRGAAIVLAVLDGAEVDSGTASEVSCSMIG